jgi:hypothetical protein
MCVNGQPWQPEHGVKPLYTGLRSMVDAAHWLGYSAGDLGTV